MHIHVGAEGTSTIITVSHPVVVKGSKAVEHALLEGQSPVIDQTVDVFAIASAKGIVDTHDWLSTYAANDHFTILLIFMQTML